MIHGLEPKEINSEAAEQLGDYWLARLAGRLNWSFGQIKQVPVEVALLCERLGWRGPEGFARLQETPEHKVRDWLVIAEMEKEREKRGSH